MGPLTEDVLLRVWEDAASRIGVARAVTLAAWAHEVPATVWDLALGERDALLMSLREQCFGTTLSCGAECPTCAEELDVGLDTKELTSARTATPLEGDDSGVPVRPVTSRDVSTARASSDPRRELVERCLRQDGALPLPAGAVDTAADRLAAADPSADLGVDLTCPACGTSWWAAFDIAAHVWAELDVFARRLLQDVHCLARAYGWREVDVLALGPMRRRYYLELVAS